MQKTEQPTFNGKVIKSINPNFLELPLCKCSNQFSSCPHKQAFGFIADEIEKGFKKGYIPKLADDGTSGCYMLRGKHRRPLAVFKPIDEEQFAPNNPRDFSGPFGSSTFRPGIISGESTIREIAAYLLDHQHFSGVPMTQLVAIDHESFKLSDSGLNGFLPNSDVQSTSSYDTLDQHNHTVF